MSEHDHLEPIREALLAKVLENAAFDGFGEQAMAAAARAGALDPALVKIAFPGGPADLAVYFSARADEAMAAAMAERETDALRIRDRVTLGVRLRLEECEPHREAVRSAVALMALPQNAATSARALWASADAIWRAAGDAATDMNHYSKRLTLGAVYSSTLLYWLGDESEGRAETWGFLDRRIDDVMTFEKAKASLRVAMAQVPRPLDPFKILSALRYPNPR